MVADVADIDKKEVAENELTVFDQHLFEIAKKVADGEVEGSTPVHAEFARRYMDALLEKPNHEEDEVDTVRLEQYVNQEMGDKLKDYILSGNIALFQEYDKKMGIHGSNRKEFNIKVLRLSNRINGQWTESEWGKETKAPTLFVSNRNTIYISEEDAVQILSGQKFSKADTLVHEYRHTQRKFASSNDRLLRIFDESATNVGMGYIQAQALLETIFLTTPDMRFNRVRQAYDNDSEDEKNKILQELERDLGSFGFLLLSSRASSEHSGDQDGLTDLPYETDLEADCGGNKNLQFLEEMLRARERTDANWLRVFRENISRFAGKDFRKLEVIKANWLGAYFKDVNNTKAEHVKSMFAVIEQTIAEGIARGEQSFYAN